MLMAVKAYVLLVAATLFLCSLAAPTEDSKQQSGPQERRRRAQYSAGDPVAFLTRLNKFELVNLQINQQLVFDEVVLNAGNGFQTSRGVFVAPVSGLYGFSASIMSYMDEEVHVTISHNGNDVANVYACGSNGRYDQGSQSVVLQLKSGDEVWTKVKDYGNMTLWGDKFTTFSGYLILPDRNSQ